MTLTQKEYKALKKEIVEKGVLEVGCNCAIWSKIDAEIMAEIMYNKDIRPQDFASEFEFKLVILHRYIESIDFQTFKTLAPYFLNYSGLVNTKAYLERKAA